MSNVKHNIQIGELFNHGFMKRNTPFETFQEMVAACPTRLTLKQVSGDHVAPEWDDFVREKTKFGDSKAMVQAALDEWKTGQSER
jgi:hypothetical protein